MRLPVIDKLYLDRKFRIFDKCDHFLQVIAAFAADTDLVILKLAFHFEAAVFNDSVDCFRVFFIDSLYEGCFLSDRAAGCFFNLSVF